MNFSFIFELDGQYTRSITPYKLRFTSSISNQTSTLITNFYTPIWLVNSLLLSDKPEQIKVVLSIENQLKLSTTDIKLLWVKGKPAVIQAVFLITSETQSITLKQVFEELNKTKDQLKLN